MDESKLAPAPLAYQNEPFLNSPDGRILRILDMAPCRAAPCKVYDPHVAFRGALEVNRGAFARWSVHRGSVVTIRRS